MTLHWWMHWFWVTMLLIVIESSERAKAAPSAGEHMTTDAIEPHRESRAMYPVIYKTTIGLSTTRTTLGEASTEKYQNDTDPVQNTSNTTDNVQQWTAINVTDGNVSIPLGNATQPNITDVTYANTTESQNATFASRKRNLTFIKDIIKDDAAIGGMSESRTEKPLSLETTFLQTRIPPNVESSRRVIDPGEGGMDTGAIAGISFAALVLTALAGSTAFVLYRRRYLNKPQTLNDKCSNPDSSGYLDDSTIRDNSEEMYSLDNDSFLNSLEAMTIQNYWTDTVKHTKL
ncbi:uncharacterized protein [Epargyreus clarus]|uniref:uncharacterized protein n=1 Tax=Epargyreus clarus TaxID=520877 RepID=UPI003C2C3824